MTNADPLPSRARPRAQLSPPVGVLLGGACLGTLDALFAISFWVSRGATAGAVFRSVAAGLLGKAAKTGGTSVAILGLGLHYFIATSMVLAYYLASRRLPWLVERPIAYGAAYGVFLYLFMNLVVLPLSAVGMPSFSNTLWVGLSVLMHAVFGVIAAFAARQTR